RGGHGMGRNRTGASAPDLVIEVPVGTQVFDEEREELLADFTEVGQRVVLLEGGMGGRGNASYATSTNRAPRQHQPGIPSQELWLWLRLKLLADVGLVGLPNAGKSTFINQVSNTRAKVGDYAFTTLVPKLGVVYHKNREFVLADIPGLIEAAADGAGIGDRFLGHIERCRVLTHLIDIPSSDPVESMEIVNAELEAYGGGLEDKPMLYVLNKVDLVDDEFAAEYAQMLMDAGASRVFAISGATGAGVSQLMDAVINHLPSRTATENPSAAAKGEEDAEQRPWDPLG